MTKAEIAAQKFLADYEEALNRYAARGQKLNYLAKQAGVSAPTVTDHKKGNKLTAPQFKIIFQVAYALMGKSPCKLTVEPEQIGIARISQAMDKDEKGLIMKLADVILKVADDGDLKYIEAPIILLSRKLIQPPYQTKILVLRASKKN
jgi:hypothetical protein